MPTVKISIWPSEGHNVDALEKVIQWPSEFHKSDEVDLCNPGFAGGPTGVVYRRKHWLGCEHGVEIYCKLVLFKKRKKERLAEEIELWKSLQEDGWKSH